MEDWKCRLFVIRFKLVPGKYCNFSWLHGPNLCILMNFPIHIDMIISMELLILYSKRSQVDVSKHRHAFLTLKIHLILANSADSDDMQHNKCSIMLKFIWVFSVRQSTH